jgi:hypothetical protein
LKATTCLAAGSYLQNGGNPQAIWEIEQGDKWSLETGVDPPGLVTAEVMSVSCRSLTLCAMTGIGDDSNGVRFTWVGAGDDWTEVSRSALRVAPDKWGEDGSDWADTTTSIARLVVTRTTLASLHGREPTSRPLGVSPGKSFCGDVLGSIRSRSSRCASARVLGYSSTNAAFEGANQRALSSHPFKVPPPANVY